MNEEKELAFQFFKTSIGKTVLIKLEEAKRHNSIIIELNRKIQQLENKVGIDEIELKDEKLIKEQLNKAVSLFQSDTKPQYLFGIINEFGELRGLYTNQLEDLRKGLVYNTEQMEEQNG